MAYLVASIRIKLDLDAEACKWLIDYLQACSGLLREDSSSLEAKLTMSTGNPREIYLKDWEAEQLRVLVQNWLLSCPEPESFRRFRHDCFTQLEQTLPERPVQPQEIDQNDIPF